MAHILIPQDVAESGKAYLRARGHTLAVGTGIDRESLLRAVGTADAMLLRNARCTREVLEAAPRLKVIARHGTGVDNVAVADAERMGIWVLNAPTANIESVAEYAVAAMMALARRLLPADAAARAGDWVFRDRTAGMELSGKTVGVVGFGHTGRLVAQKAVNGLNMRALVCSRHPPRELPPGMEAAALDELLARSDFVSLHVPLTAQTRGLLDYRRLCLMKPGAYLINTARGAVCVPQDLTRALTEGRIAGAALDVFAQEAVPDDLRRLPQVLLSPHIAGLTREALDRMSLFAAQGIDDVLSGRPPRWPVNHPAAPRR